MPHLRQVQNTLYLIESITHVINFYSEIISDAILLSFLPAIRTVSICSVHVGA